MVVLYVLELFFFSFKVDYPIRFAPPVADRRAGECASLTPKGGSISLMKRATVRSSFTARMSLKRAMPMGTTRAARSQAFCLIVVGKKA